jgi:hypothetical protein
VALHRLAKAGDSLTAGSCPALYSTSDPARMIGQGKILTSAGYSPADPTWMIWRGQAISPTERRELLEVEDDEMGVALPTETVFRRAAGYVAGNGHGALAAQLEAFLSARGLWSGPRLTPDASGDGPAVAIRAETVLRSVAKHATENGDDVLPGQIEAFLAERGL